MSAEIIDRDGNFMRFVRLCERKCEYLDNWTDQEKFIWGKVYHEMGFESRHKWWKRAPVERKRWLVIRHNAACLAVWATQEVNSIPPNSTASPETRP